MTNIKFWICLTCNRLVTELCCYGRARPAREYEVFMGIGLTPLDEIDVKRTLASMLKNLAVVESQA